MLLTEGLLRSCFSLVNFIINLVLPFVKEIINELRKSNLILAE